MGNNADKFQRAMDELRRGYVRDLWQREEILSKALEKIANGSFDKDDLYPIEAVAHKLVGTGRTYAFPLISEKAFVVENLARKRDAQLQAPLAASIEELIEACQQAKSEFEALDQQKNSSVAEDEDAQTEQVDVELPSEWPNVLIVEDDEQTSRLLKQFIQEYASCEIATNPSDASELMAVQRFDLVLLDNQMPGEISGVDFLKEIKANPETDRVDVVMITASGEPQTVLDSLTAGAADYVLKPFDASDVARKLHTRLAHLKQTIMIVDDDLAIQNLLTAKFRTLGLRCVCYADGLVAMENLEKVKPDLVILDRILPGLEGVAVLRQMRNQKGYEEVPVVILSAKREADEVMLGLRAGAAEYLVKPFNLDELVLRCQRLLDASPIKSEQMRMRG